MDKTCTFETLMDTKDTKTENREIFFTPWHTLRKNSRGETGMDETFYINKDFPDQAKEHMLHCFAFGVSRWGGDWCIKKEYGRYISFNFFLEGGVIIQNSENTFHVKAGDLLVARRSPLQMRTAPGGMARKYCLLLSNTAIPAAICDFLMPSDPGILHVKEPRRIIRSLESIGEYVRKGSSCRELEALLFSFLLEVQAEVQKINSLPILLEKALGCLRQSDFRLSRSELADVCGVSTRTLTRLFIRHLRLPPGQYIIQCRLEKAARLLSISNEPVKNIAGECGFSSPMFFAREFKKYYQCTPTEFRKQKRHPGAGVS